MESLATGETIVTPTRRLAYFLKERWNETCLAEGLRVWRTPDILAWDALIERCFVRDRQAGRLQARWLPVSTARLQWQRIVRADSEALAILAKDGLAAAAHRSWQRLHEYRIPLSALDEADTAESTALRRWSQRYRRWLEAGRWMDASLAPALLSTESLPDGLRMFGFDSLTPAQEAFLERMQEARVSIRNDAGPARRGRCTKVMFNDEKEEIDAAARWAAQRLQARPGDRLALVVPGLRERREDLRRALNAVFEPGLMLTGSSTAPSRLFELAAAAPLSSAPPVAGALEVLTAFIGPDEVVGAERLLGVSYCRGYEQEALARAGLDARRLGRGERGLSPQALEWLAERGDCPELATMLHAGRQAIEKWPEKALASIWAKKFFELLDITGWPGTALDSAEHQARQRWQTLLADFGATEAVTGDLNQREAFGVLKSMAGQALFEPEQPHGPLLVIDPDTCAGMDFDGLWLSGLDASHWPATVSPDPFLPRTWQVRRAVPGAAASVNLAIAQRLFARLCSSADEVIVSIPAHDAEAKLQPSALVADLEEQTLPATWPTSSVAETIFSARPQVVWRKDAFMPELDTTGATPGGARVLELQAACGFRAHSEQRLGAHALEQPQAGVDAATRGSLAHKVLENLWRELGNSGDLAALTAEDRSQRVRQTIEPQLARLARGAHPVTAGILQLEAAWLEEQIMRLLDIDAGRETFTVENLEVSYALQIGGLTLDLRPDRVDRLKDGSLALIDYKTGSSAEIGAWLDERPALPQLPLYLLAVGPSEVSAIAFGRLRAGQTGYEGLVRAGGLFDELKVFDGKGRTREFDSWQQMITVWRRRLETLADEYRSGDARLAANPTQACTYCQLSVLCRKSELGVQDDE